MRPSSSQHGRPIQSLAQPRWNETQEHDLYLIRFSQPKWTTQLIHRNDSIQLMVLPNHRSCRESLISLIRNQR